MQLLISVTSDDEARIAIAASRDIILDVKNPLEGSLGAQFPHILQQIRASVPKPLKVSAAIGDMPNLPGTAALAALGAATCDVDYIKVGLWGPKTEAEAIFLLQHVRRAVINFPDVAVIAAAYADAQRANTLDPGRLPHIARSANVQGCLIDTAIKDGRSLFDFLTPEALRSLAKTTHAMGLIFALAGTLHEHDLLRVRNLGADVAGVRTAACRDNCRTGPLDADRVRRLCEIIRG